MSMNDSMNDSADAVTPKILVAYHANCIDGFTSAWLAYRALEGRGYDVSYLAMDYTQVDRDRLLDVIDGGGIDRLTILDYSLPPSMLAELEQEYPDLKSLTLDHHKTAFEAYAPSHIVDEESVCFHRKANSILILKNSKSGASLALSHFQEVGLLEKDEIAPEFIALVEDYDLWRFKYGDRTHHTNSYLCSLPMTFKEWDDINTVLSTNEGLIRIGNEGRAIYESHLAEVDRLLETAKPVHTAGVEGLVVECDPKYTNELGEKLAEKSGTYGAVISSNPGNRGGEVKVSLRSTKESGFDVSELAKRLGGGGHKTAASYYILRRREEERNKT